MDKTDQDCLFCKMAAGLIPVPKVFEDDRFFVIRDIHPQAKTHLLIIPKVHVESLLQGCPNGLFEVATKVAAQEGLAVGGFRSVINTGKNGGQSVFHLHLHVLGGEALGSRFGK
jgi:histidine triad (HIT) family protein